MGFKVGFLFGNGKKRKYKKALEITDELLNNIDFSKGAINQANILQIGERLADVVKDLPIEMRDRLANDIKMKINNVLTIRKGWLRETEKEIERLFREIEIYEAKGMSPPPSLKKQIKDKDMYADLYEITIFTYTRLADMLVDAVREAAPIEVRMRILETINRVLEMSFEKMGSRIEAFHDQFYSVSEEEFERIRQKHQEMVQQPEETITRDPELEKIRKKRLRTLS